MKTPSFVSVCALCAVAGLAASAPAAEFVPGNLAISMVGPTVNATNPANQSSLATAVRISEFDLDKSLFLAGSFRANDLLLPSASTDATRLTTSGSAAETFLNRSADGRYLTLIGYDAISGQSGLNPGSSIATSQNHTGGSGTLVNRTVARVDITQSTNLYRLTQTYSASNVRSATSIDGSTFVLAGTPGNGSVTSGGLRSFDPSAGTTTSQIIAGTFRVANYAGSSNNLYYSLQSTTAGLTGIYQVNTSTNTATILPGFASATGLSPYDFFFSDSSTLYIADDGATSGQGGLQKWTFNGTSWSLAYRISAGLTTGLRGLTGTVTDNGDVYLFATSNDSVTKLVAVRDTGAGSSFTTLASAQAGYAFRGVRFTPVPAPGAAALVGLGGLVVARRRR